MNTSFSAESERWFQTEKFERFWDVYHKYMIYAHQDVLSRCYETGNTLAAILYKMVKAPLPQSYSDFCEKSKQIKKRKRKRKKKQMKNSDEKKKSVPPIQEDVFVLTDDDTLQVKLQEQMKIEDSEVDEDFLTFMKTSVMHRIKWQQIKKEKNEEVLSDIEKREHPDITREKALKELYGESAAQIHGMETALQLSFDRISTLHQPSIWPNIPLKLRFD